VVRPFYGLGGWVVFSVKRRSRMMDYRRLEAVSKQIIKVCASRAREMFVKESDVV
jgi:hypothetical protein